MKTYWTEVPSPVGKIRIFADEDALTYVDISGECPRPKGNPARNDVLRKAEKQFAEYFAGKREEFDLPLSFEGTEFQKKVWKALQRIPFGQTRTYGQIAKSLKSPAASRAVGTACGRNPLSIVIPCHRVVGSNGSLTGFGGGLAMKEWLLKHEGLSL
ncbi:methylated-DNA--[protein]-cysteine S-methyltransferase [candidate division KSB1 bacterium]|nr:MAG: methylated-DNA--[protein]-cysteine S-methyltransferase [candidate division KSB1 bacterium]